jgi:hypothetical protein
MSIAEVFTIVTLPLQMVKFIDELTKVAYKKPSVALIIFRKMFL